MAPDGSDMKAGCQPSGMASPRRTRRLIGLFVTASVLLAALLGIGGGMLLTAEDTDAGMQAPIVPLRPFVPANQ